MIPERFLIFKISEEEKFNKLSYMSWKSPGKHVGSPGNVLDFLIKSLKFEINVLESLGSFQKYIY